MSTFFQTKSAEMKIIDHLFFVIKPHFVMRSIVIPPLFQRLRIGGNSTATKISLNPPQTHTANTSPILITVVGDAPDALRAPGGGQGAGGPSGKRNFKNGDSGPLQKWSEHTRTDTTLIVSIL
jgi:hypothetical protein